MPAAAVGRGSCCCIVVEEAIHGHGGFGWGK